MTPLTQDQLDKTGLEYLEMVHKWRRFWTLEYESYLHAAESAKMIVEELDATIAKVKKQLGIGAK